MIRLVLGEPSPKQRLFLTAKTRNVGYGGGRGGGKTWAARTKSSVNGLGLPGVKQLIVRQSYPELLQNHIEPLRQSLHGIARYNDRDKMLKFCNGSTIRFMYCERDRDLDRLQGQEYDDIFLDEAEHLTEHQMKVIGACLRGANQFPKHMFYLFNPGGQGHQFLRRIFVDRQFEENEKPEDYVFIQALVRDNKVLMENDPEYIRQLEALPYKLRRAWLEGDWDIFEGMFFEEFRAGVDLDACRKAGLEPEGAAAAGKYTHVIRGFQPPDGWRIYRSFDWGYARPFSCGWWAVDYDGRLYRILELYGCTRTPNEGLKWTPDQVFREIARIEREHPWLQGKRIDGVADPAIWDASTGVSIEETASRYGIYFEKGDHARIPGWMQCHYRLAFDDNGRPMMYVFDNCKAFIRTIPTLMYDEHKVEDLDTESEDHVADEWRYMCMSRPIKPMEPREARVIYADPLDQFRGNTKVRYAPGFGF